MRLRTAVLMGIPYIAAAAPLSANRIERRAGGPSSVPIPANCTIINPMPGAGAQCNSTVGSVDGWAPSNNFTAAHSLYSSYFEGFMTVADQWEQCSQQCYGYGTPGTCKAVLLAYNVPTPPGYDGSSSSTLETACLMFDAYPDPNSFVAATVGQYINETAANIYCPT